MESTKSYSPKEFLDKITEDKHLTRLIFDKLGDGAVVICPDTTGNSIGHKATFIRVEQELTAYESAKLMLQIIRAIPGAESDGLSDKRKGIVEEIYKFSTQKR